MKYIKKAKLGKYLVDTMNSGTNNGNKVLFVPENIYVVQPKDPNLNLKTAESFSLARIGTDVRYLPDFLPIETALAKIPNCHRGFKISQKNNIITPLNPYLNIVLTDYTNVIKPCALKIEDISIFNTEPYVLIKIFNQQIGNFVGDLTDTFAVLLSDLESDIDPQITDEHYAVYENSDIAKITPQPYVAQTIIDNNKHHIFYPLGLTAFCTVTQHGACGKLLNNPSKVKARKIVENYCDFYIADASLVLTQNKSGYRPDKFQASLAPSQDRSFYSTSTYQQSIEQVDIQDTKTQIQSFLGRKKQYRDETDVRTDNHEIDLFYDITSDFRHGFARYHYGRQPVYYLTPAHLGTDYSNISNIDSVVLIFEPVGKIQIVENTLTISNTDHKHLYLKTPDGFASIDGCKTNILPSVNSKSSNSREYYIGTPRNQYIVDINNDLYLPIDSRLIYQYIVSNHQIHKLDGFDLNTVTINVFQRTFTSNKSQKLKPIKIEPYAYAAFWEITMTMMDNTVVKSKIAYSELLPGEKIG